jgi:hypothetical protein
MLAVFLTAVGGLDAPGRIASKAGFTALRASSERPGGNIRLKLRDVTSADLLCMAAPPFTDHVCLSYEKGTDLNTE